MNPFVCKSQRPNENRIVLRITVDRACWITWYNLPAEQRIALVVK